MYESHLCSLLSALLEENLYPSLHIACRALLFSSDFPTPSPPPSSNGSDRTGGPTAPSDGRYVISGEEIDARLPLFVVHPLHQLLQAVLGILPTLPANSTDNSSSSSGVLEPLISLSPSAHHSIAPEIISYCEVIRSCLSASALHLVPTTPLFPLTSLVFQTLRLRAQRLPPRSSPRVF